MKTIWKYELKPNRQIKMPKNSKVLSVGNQYDQIMVWAEVYSDETRMETKYFDVYETGHEIYEGMGVARNFIGSVVLHNGMVVFHVYERLL